MFDDTVRRERETEPVLLRAGASRLDVVLDLLEDSQLPTAGVAEAADGFFVAEERGRVVAVAGLEVHGPYGVLRSVAVSRPFRGRGLGGRLTERVLETARTAGLCRLYLLTTTAEEYFRRRGFYRVAREEVPAEVRSSVEFREACPASAVAMVLELE